MNTNLARKTLEKVVLSLQYGARNLKTNQDLAEFLGIGGSTLTKILAPKRDLLEVEIILRGLVLMSPTELLRLLSAAAYDGIPLDAGFIANVVLDGKKPIITEGEPAEHILISGGIGAGKSSMAKLLMNQAFLDHGPCIYLGRKGERFRANPNLRAVGFSPTQRFEEAGEIIKQAVATIIETLQNAPADEEVTLIVDEYLWWASHPKGEKLQSTIEEFLRCRNTRFVVVTQTVPHSLNLRAFAKVIGMKNGESLDAAFRNGLSDSDHPLAQLKNHDFMMLTTTTGHIQRFNVIEETLPWYKGARTPHVNIFNNPTATASPAQNSQ